MRKGFRSFINGFAGVLGLALLLGGLLVPDTGLWRLMLLAGLWLLSLPLRGADPKASPNKRGLSGLLLLFGLAFLAVGLQLMRDQVGQAGQSTRSVEEVRAQAGGLGERAEQAPADRLGHLGTAHLEKPDRLALPAQPAAAGGAPELERQGAGAVRRHGERGPA